MLTICLWTRGREDFLPNTLLSFEKLFKYDFINFMLIDNGSSQEAQKILANWVRKFPDRTYIYRFEVNDTRFSKSWKLIREYATDWIVFPGDDDEFVPEIIEEWIESLQTHPNLVAFNASLQVINADGKASKINIYPNAAGIKNKIESIAQSFHCPPFNWPSLFFKLSAIPEEIPNSRYACDWWIGCNLLLSGEVLTTKSIGIRYRRHIGQESQRAPLRRKNFESYIWLSKLINGKIYLDWVRSLSDEEKIIFWDYLTANPPIYGDEVFNKLLLASIYFSLLHEIKSLAEKIILINRYASLNGVLLHKGQVVNLLELNQTENILFSSNYSLQLGQGGCEKLIYILNNYDASAAYFNFKIYCIHSQKLNDGVFIDCAKLKESDTEYNLDFITKEITNFLEQSDLFNFSISPKERKIILILRSYKRFIPQWSLNFLRRM
jgi:hypothetical protein